MAINDKPNASDIPTSPRPSISPMAFPAITALPHPIKTNVNVPINSAIYFLISSKNSLPPVIF